MKTILVIGGTRFFGKKAVYRLLEKGYQVTIATRGHKSHPFGDQVKHVQLDVTDSSHKGWHEITSQKWEAIFNNICYTKEDAQLMIDKFSGLTEHFYFTSTMAVYSGAKDGYVETDFDPFTYEINPKIEVDYGEGKRQAEVVLFNDAPFDVTAFRFPIVLDTDDYTERLLFYMEKALNGETIYFESPDYKVNYVKGTTAADAIVWLMEQDKKGIYNVSSKDAVTIKTLMNWLEEVVEGPVKVIYTGKKVLNSPFSVSHDQYLISDKIMNEGFKLLSLAEWMRPLMREIGSGKN